MKKIVCDMFISRVVACQLSDDVLMAVYNGIPLVACQLSDDVLMAVYDGIPFHITAFQLPLSWNIGLARGSLDWLGISR